MMKKQRSGPAVMAEPDLCLSVVIAKELLQITEKA